LKRSSPVRLVTVSSVKGFQIDQVILVSGKPYLVVGVRDDHRHLPQIAVKPLSRTWRTVLWLERKTRMLSRVTHHPRGSSHRRD